MPLMRLLAGLVVCLALSPAPAYAQATDELAAKSHRGKELMAEGRFEEAIPIYRDLVRALPNNPGPVMNLGLALHMAGHEQEAAREFEEVLKLEPAHLPAHLFLGAAYLGLKEPAKAIGPLRAVVRAQPNNPEARQILGEALLALERYEPAAEQYEKLAKLDPENPKAWNGLGVSYEGLASRNFEELEKIAPESASWLVLVAEARAKADQDKPAFFFYREALARMPTLRGVHVAVAAIYRKAGHPDWAAREEEKERQLPPLACSSADRASASPLGASGRKGAAAPRGGGRDSPPKLECDFWAGRYPEVVGSSDGAKTEEAYYWRTRAYNELARAAFSRLAELRSSAEVHELLAKIHFSQHNYPAAAKDWQEALKFSPGNPFYLQRLGVSLGAGADYEHARPILENLVKQSSDSVELNYWLGYTLLGLEKPAEAIPYLNKAVERDPMLLQSHRDLGRAYWRVGQVEKAIPHLKAALPIDDDGSLYYQLAQAYRRTGQRELEMEMLKTFQEIQSSTAVEKKRLEQQMQITPP